MDNRAMFKLTYGLFIAGCGFEGKDYGCVINTGIQVTATPNKMSVTMMKTNTTTQTILKKGSLCITILGENTPLDVISDFGMKKSSETDKFYGYETLRDAEGNPYIKNGMIARMSLKIIEKIDLGTHYMFICDVADCEVMGAEAPMTYEMYRNKKASGAKKKWVCSVCHYVYDGKIPFEQLQDSFKCPICGQPKSVFVAE